MPKDSKITLVTILLVLVLVSAVFVLFKKPAPGAEGYGQDASSRVQAGWVAGPSYGEDPITKFAKQIAEMRKLEAEGRSHGPQGQLIDV